MFACNSSQGNYLLVQYLVDHAGANPNARNDANKNALHLAA